jgi:hypothetical protein
MSKNTFLLYSNLIHSSLINMEIPTAKYGKTTKNMEKIHVRMRVKIQ